MAIVIASLLVISTERSRGCKRTKERYPEQGAE